MNDDLETAVQLVREAGLSTGHADNCVELVREVVEQCEALRRKQELEQERRQKLYHLDHLTRRRCCVEEPPGLVLSDEGDPPASDTGLLRSPEGRMYLAVRWGDGEWTNDQTYEADIIEGVGPGWTWTPPHCADVYS